MKGRVEGTVLHLQHVFASPLNVLGNEVSVRRAEKQRAQDQHVESALQKFNAIRRFGFRRHGRHSTTTDGRRATIISFSKGRVRSDQNPNSDGVRSTPSQGRLGYYSATKRGGSAWLGKSRVRAAPLLVNLLLVASSYFYQTLVWRSPLPPPSKAAALLQAVCPGAVQAGGSAPASVPDCKPCPPYTTVGHLQPRMAIRQSLGLRTV